MDGQRGFSLISVSNGKSVECCWLPAATRGWSGEKGGNEGTPSQEVSSGQRGKHGKMEPLWGVGEFGVMTKSLITPVQLESNAADCVQSRSDGASAPVSPRVVVEDDMKRMRG